MLQAQCKGLAVYLIGSLWQVNTGAKVTALGRGHCAVSRGQLRFFFSLKVNVPTALRTPPGFLILGHALGGSLLWILENQAWGSPPPNPDAGLD